MSEKKLPKYRVLLEVKESDEVQAESLVKYAIEQSGKPKKFRIISIHPHQDPRPARHEKRRGRSPSMP